MPRRLSSALHADLLRALALAGDDVVVANRLAGRLGFVPAIAQQAMPLLEDANSAHLAADPPASSPTVAQTAETPTPEGPLQATMLVVTAVSPTQAKALAPQANLPALQVADCLPRSAGPAPSGASLVVRAALWPALRRTVSNYHEAGVDVHALTRALARAIHFRRLPRRRHRSQASQLWVLQEVSDRLAPYQADFEATVDQLLALRGNEGMTVWHFRSLPEHTLSRITTAGEFAWPGPLPKPPVGQRLLVLSDLGALAQGRSLELAWQGVFRTWQRAGAAVTVWSPMGPRQVPTALAGAVPVHCLGGRASLRRQRGAWASAAQRQAEHQRLRQLVQKLQVLAACAVELEPALLRDLRLLQPDLATEPGLEALFWQSPEVDRSRAGRVLLPAPAQLCRAQFQGLPVPLQVQVLVTMRRRHAFNGRSTEQTEALLWRTHASDEARLWPGLADALAAVDLWWDRLYARLGNSDGWTPALRSFARDVLQRQAHDQSWQVQCGKQVAALAVFADQGQTMPAHVPALEVLAAIGVRQHLTPQTWSLIQRDRWLWVWPVDEPLPPRASLLHMPVSGTALVIDRPNMARRVVTLTEQAQAVVELIGNPFPMRLSTEQGTLTLDAMRRPQWAAAWGRDGNWRQGLFAQAVMPWGELTPLRPWHGDGWLRWAGGHAIRRATGAWFSLSEYSPVLKDEFNRPPIPVRVLAAAEDGAWRDWVLRRLRQDLQALPVVFWDDRLPGQDGDGSDRPLVVVVVVLLSNALVQEKAPMAFELALLQQAVRQQDAMYGVVVLDDVDASRWSHANLLSQAFRVLEGPLASQADQVREAMWRSWLPGLKKAIDALMMRHYSARSGAGEKPDDIRFIGGADSEHGLFADLHFIQAVQRFRYLPPGEFWMGSSDEEWALRGYKAWQRIEQNGSHRHRVRLSEGFWLADTACTQALWLAVMRGKNPSQFADNPDNPVEQVSWDDVQLFLQRLQPMLPPGCQAVLPTEAEWEYACRAGSDTPFSFGNQITTAQANYAAQANYDGDYPYGDGPKGEYRGRTVPVKALPANAWGLHQMHGNVWEWCADGAFRDYSRVGQGQVIENPFQPPEQGPEAHRVVRGGGWGNHAGSLRSALRRASQRGDRNGNLGFRLALRPSSTSPAPGLLAPEALQDLAQGRDGPKPVARRDAGPGSPAKAAQARPKAVKKR